MPKSLLLGDDVLFALCNMPIASTQKALIHLRDKCFPYAALNNDEVTVCTTVAAKSRVAAEVNRCNSPLIKEAYRKYMAAMTAHGVVYSFGEAVSNRRTQILEYRETLRLGLADRRYELSGTQSNPDSYKNGNQISEDEIWECAAASQHDCIWVTEVTPALRLFRHHFEVCQLFDPWNNEFHPE